MISRLTVVLLIGVVALGWAAPAADTKLEDRELLKRILSALSEQAEEKRSMTLFSFNAKTDKLTVSFHACVEGDRSTTPCRPVTGHSLEILDEAGDVVYSKTVKYLDNYVGPRESFDLSHVVRHGEKYTIKACEIMEKGGHHIFCNEGTIVGGSDVNNQFGGSVSDTKY